MKKQHLLLLLVVVVLSLTMSKCDAWQAQPGLRMVVCADAGANDTYTCTASPTVASYTGLPLVRLTVNTANTGAATLNIDSVGAKSLVKLVGTVSTALQDGDLLPKGEYFVAYNATDDNFKVLTNVGNPIKGLFPVEMALPVVGCSGTTGVLLWNTLATNAPTATCSAGSTETTLMRGTADFPDSDGDYSIQIALALPSDWAGPVDVQLRYRNSVGSANDVVWQAQTAFIADGTVEDVAFNSASTVTDAQKGTANQLNDATISSVTITGSGTTRTMYLKILRNRTHANDTTAGVVSLSQVLLKSWRVIQ